MERTNYYPKLTQTNADRFNRTAKTCPTQLTLKHVNEALLSEDKKAKIVKGCDFGRLNDRYVIDLGNYYAAKSINEFPIGKSGSAIFAGTNKDNYVKTHLDYCYLDNPEIEYERKKIDCKVRGAIISAICEHMRKTEREEKSK